MKKGSLARKAVTTHLEKVRWNEDGTYRGMCPSCGSKNSFGAKRERGSVVYNCFVASCALSGGYDREITVGELVRLHTAPSEAAPFEVPVHFLPLKASPQGLEYLQKFESYPQLLLNRETIRFDPRLNRVVFLVRNSKGIVTDAAGRGINSTIKPKWLRYGNSSDLYFSSSSDAGVGLNPKRLIVVEDAMSACAVCEYGTGGALLGTHLTDEAKLQISRYDDVIIALDKDASKKAVDIATVIRPLVGKCRTVLLERDLKYYGSGEIRGQLGLA